MNVEPGIDRVVRAELRGKELDREPRIDDAPRLAVSEQPLLVKTVREERRDHALVRFEHIGVRREAALREQCRIEPARRRVAAMRALRHRADVSEQRTRARRRDTERMAHAVDVESQHCRCHD